jgi:hypothetical protein
MVDEQTVSRVCKARGMTEHKVGLFPFWMDANRQEGIELKAGKLYPFWNIDNAKNYDEPTGDKILQTIKLIEIENIGKKDSEEDEAETKKNKEGKQAEAKGNKETNINENTTTICNYADDKKREECLTKDNFKPVNFVNQLPKVFSGERIIVPQDIVELKSMSTFDRIMLFQKTHPSIIKEKNGRGGKQKYVEGGIMKMEANIAFLFCISSKIDGWEFENDEKGIIKSVSCYGSIKVNIDGKEVMVSDIGGDIQEYAKADNRPVFTKMDLMKSACTDMKKRCLSNLGFNGDIYRGEV